MKRLSVVLTVIIMLLSPSLSAFGVGYENGRFSFTLPDGFTQDTQWAQENGYIDSWYNEDMTFEVMYYIDETGTSFLPRLWEYEEDYNLCREYTASEIYSSYSTWYNEGDHSFNGHECKYYRYEINTDESDLTTYLNLYEYIFPVDELNSYCVLFADYTGRHSAQAQEIIGTVKITQEKFSLTDYITEVCAIACGGTLLTGIINYIKNKRKKQMT